MKRFAILALQLCAVCTVIPSDCDPDSPALKGIVHPVMNDIYSPFIRSFLM